MSGRANEPALPSSEKDARQPIPSSSGRRPPPPPTQPRPPPLASSHPSVFPFDLARTEEPRLPFSTFNPPMFRPFGAAQAPHVRPPNLESGHPTGCPPGAAQAGPPAPLSLLQQASILHGVFPRSVPPVQNAPESGRRAGPQFAGRAAYPFPRRVDPLLAGGSWPNFPAGASSQSTGGAANQSPPRAGPQTARGTAPQSSAGAGPNFAGGAGLQPGGGTGLQYGGGAGVQTPMDPFRLWLKSEMTTAVGTFKGFQGRLAAFDSDDMRETRASLGSSVVSEYRRRCKFMIDDAKARYKKCREEFVYSYQSAIRDCGYSEYTSSYCPRINEVLQNEADPRKRLRIFRAMESSLLSDDSPEKRSLVLQLELAIDEALRIISGTAHLESTTTPRTIHRTLSDDLASAAQGRTRGSAQTIIGYSRRRIAQDSPAQDDAAEASDPALGEVTSPPSAIPVPGVPAAVSAGSLGWTQATDPSRKRSTPEVPSAPRAPARSQAGSPHRKKPTQGRPAHLDTTIPPKKRSNRTRSVDTARAGAVEFRPARVAVAGAVPGVETRVAAAATLHARRGPSGAGPSDAGPSGAGPSGAGPSGAGPSGAGPSGAGPSGAGPSGAVPSGTGPSQPGPSRSSGVGPSTAEGRPPGVGPAGPSNRC
jgi:hypothetical protein